MPPDKGKGPPGRSGPSSENVAADQSDCPHNTLSLDPAQLAPRDVRPDEVPELRRLWWRQAGLGHRLPPEIDVIVIEGGAL